MASGRRIRIADSGFKPERIIVKMIKQVAIELREAKKPLVVDNRPITARATEAKPTNGERKVLSSVVFQEKKGKKAIWRLVRKWSKLKSGARSNSLAMGGLINTAITSAAPPARMINVVITSGMIGRVLIVKRKCG